MAVQNSTRPFALAWFLLAGLLLRGEAIGSRCKQQQVRERKPTFEILFWQEAYLPLAVILGGCCGLVWWVLFVIYDVSQKGGQKGLPQISGEVGLEEQKARALDHKEEWTQVEAKGNVVHHMKFAPRPPSQPNEQSHPTFWFHLEQVLERVLTAVRCHRTTGETPTAEEKTNTNIVAGEKPSPPAGDLQSILDSIKQCLSTIEGQSSLDKQQLVPGEGPSSQSVDKQPPLSKEGQSSPAKDKQQPEFKEKQRKKSLRRSRSRSKRKATPSPSSRRRRGSSGRRCPCCKH